MMKTIGVVTTLCLLIFSCQGMLPNHPDTASVSSPATELTVTFTGMVVFVIPTGGVQRAVVLRVPGHKQQITFPKSMKTEVEAMFKKTTCGGDCPVDFDDVAFQIVDASGSTPNTAFNPINGFSGSSPTVTNLSGVPLPTPVKDTFDAGNIEKDVFDPPKKSTLIGGFFALNGGDGRVTSFKCTAHWDNDLKTTRSFARLVSVTFKLLPGSRLQANKDGAGWKDLVTLTTLPGPLTFSVDNNLGGMSHFDNYALLSTKRVNGLKVKLPDVNRDDPTCKEKGDVPGCSDTQWP
ncbi:MAG TPA: hypothetical protein VHX14_09195 [Thermoanaerobaculia bacterium]|nr:hypothetical protein [Thermoanaerobaculia bacterium]